MFANYQNFLSQNPINRNSRKRPSLVSDRDHLLAAWFNIFPLFFTLVIDHLTLDHSMFAEFTTPLRVYVRIRNLKIACNSPYSRCPPFLHSLLRTDGIKKVMSCGFSGGKQVTNFSSTRNRSQLCLLLTTENE